MDRILACVLILCGVGHTFGSFRAYGSNQMMLLWSLCASLFVFLLGSLNLVRISRERDVAITWLCLIAGLCHIATSLRFGYLIGDAFNFRPVIFEVVVFGLCLMCVRTLAARE
jgi:hypothetical protein